MKNKVSEAKGDEGSVCEFSSGRKSATGDKKLSIADF